MKNNELPWVKEYKVFGIPKTFKPYPDEPVFHMLENNAKKYKKMGLIQFDYKMTYPEVKDHVERLATALSDFGLKKGDRVATILPSSIQFIIADFAISRAGLVHIPSSFLEPSTVLEHKFKEGTPGAIICLDKYLDTVKEIIKRTKIKQLILTSIEDYSLNPPKEHMNVNINNSYWMTDLIKNTAPNSPEISFDVEKDLETLLFTGGTTGLPKGCMLTHRNIYANAIQNVNALGPLQKITKGAISVILGLPFFHSYGHVIMHAMIYNGFNLIIIPDPRDTKGMVAMIRKYKPNLQLGVPAQFMKLSEEDLKDISILGIAGSAPLPESTQKEIEKTSSSGVMEGYGLSEMSPVTHLNTSLLIRLFGGRTLVRISNIFLSLPGVTQFLNLILRLLGSQRTGSLLSVIFGFLFKLSMGKPKKTKYEKRGTIGILFPDTEVKLVDIETGKNLTWEEALAGKKGEMFLKGPQRMLGYWPKPGDGLDKEGYVITGDVVRLDENGYFYIVDRTKDMIIVSGYKVYTREMDDILTLHEDIELAATVGIPDPEKQGSEIVIVFVQPKSSAKSRITGDNIKEYLRSKVAKYAVPKVVKIIDEIPLTPVEKVDKKMLRIIAQKEISVSAK